MSRARRFIFILVLCVGAGVGAPAVRADFWYEHYDRAEKALEREDWQGAIEQLNAALEKKGDSSPNARTYGVNTVQYFPYYKMGVAYYRMGEFEAAERAFETEERLSQIQKARGTFEELQRLQGLIATAREEQQEEEAQRIREMTAENIGQAERLEREGKLEEAIEAVNRALAVDQENGRALDVLSRLRGAIAQRDERRQLESRVAELVATGRGLLDEGRYEEAASTLNQAQALIPSDDVGRLLDQAQSSLRAEIQGRENEDQRRQTVSNGLDDVARLMNVGNADAAAQALQTVLALEPGNARALELQRQISEMQTRAEEERLRNASLEELLARAQEHMDKERYEQALVATNRALAIDGTNARALGLVGRAYRALNQSLAARGSVNLPALINWLGYRNLEAGGISIESVRDAQYRLQGMVIDDSPAERVAVFLAHYPCHRFFGCLGPTKRLERAVAAYRELSEGGGELAAIDDAVLEPIPLGDISLTRFSLPHSLSAGLTIFSVLSVDPSGESKRDQYVVWYVAPFYKTAWFYSLLAVGAAATVGGVYLQRARRRKKLLERRFNPYVAGAPILQDDGYYGRDRLMHRVMQSIHNNSILLYGERRIGKTSFQHRLRNRLLAVDDPEFQFYPVYIDLQGTPQERFFSTLGEEIFEELGPILDGVKPNEKLAEGEAYTHRELTRDLRAVLKVLRAKSKKTPKLVLQIDEVDELNDYDPRINQRLRSLFMKSFAENLAAVVSGVSIKKHWESEGSPWYNFFEEVPVEPFQRKDAEELIRNPIRGIFKIEDTAVERILELTECKPYLIQKLCVSVVKNMHDGKRSTVTVADVDAIERPGPDPAMEA